MINPAIIAVINPLSGETPDAMAKAMANGSATIPTIRPAIRSLRSCSLVIPFFKREKNLGVKWDLFIIACKTESD